MRLRVAFLAILLASTFATPQSQVRDARMRILLDEAHHNLFATASDGYRPFVGAVQEAGFVLTTNGVPFSAERLRATDLLLIANPNGADGSVSVEQRTKPAFSADEIESVQQWVAAGGALLVAVDHYPSGVAAQALAERFGVRLSGGWVDDPMHRRSVSGYGAIFGYLVFARDNGLLGDHPILRGRDRSEAVRAVTTTTGDSMEGPPSSTSLLRLGPAAVDWQPLTSMMPSTLPAPQPATVEPRDFNPCPTCGRRSAAGRSQGLAFEFGQGRVVFLGEMGVLTDYSVREMDNRQFTLNVVRWLLRGL